MCRTAQMKPMPKALEKLPLAVPFAKFHCLTTTNWTTKFHDSQAKLVPVSSIWLYSLCLSVRKYRFCSNIVISSPLWLLPVPRQSAKRRQMHQMIWIPINEIGYA
ncbi:hypothetical protein CEXT_378311, partial [Caerostris extrusa]